MDDQGPLIRIGIPPIGDHPAGTELGRPLQDRQKEVHLARCARSITCGWRLTAWTANVPGRSAPEIWPPPDANRGAAGLLVDADKEQTAWCAVLSDAFPPRLPIVIRQTPVRDAMDYGRETIVKED
jgi:hypothetical protein